MPWYPAILAAHNIGGSNIDTTGAAGDSVASLNNILTNCGVAIGVILVLAAVIKLIMAQANESAGDNQRGSLMLGVGIMFISISSVMSMLGVNQINSSSTAGSVAVNVIQVICAICGYGGAILIVVGAIRYVAGIAQEAPDGMAKATMDIVIGVGLIAANSLGTLLSGFIVSDESDGNVYINAVAGWFATLMTYAGGLFLILSVFKLVNSIRTEDTRERDAAFRLALVAISLFGFRVLLKYIGLDASIDNYTTF